MNKLSLYTVRHTNESDRIMTFKGLKEAKAYITSLRTYLSNPKDVILEKWHIDVIKLEKS